MNPETYELICRIITFLLQTGFIAVFVMLAIFGVAMLFSIFSPTLFFKGEFNEKADK